ncbi:hypothetical protein [Methanobacterium sp. 42_16]|nr:hypothetical protein [Methanobacterium sp. 42_16]
MRHEYKISTDLAGAGSPPTTRNTIRVSYRDGGPNPVHRGYA